MTEQENAFVTALYLERKGIYSITHIESRRSYVGGCSTLQARWNQHRSSLNAGKNPCKKMQADWNDFGENAFVFNVIEYVEFSWDIPPREIHWIQSLSPEYNTQMPSLMYRHAFARLIAPYLTSDLARKLSIDTLSVARWKTSHDLPSEELFGAIVQATGISLDAIVAVVTEQRASQYRSDIENATRR